MAMAMTMVMRRVTAGALAAALLTAAAGCGDDDDAASTTTQRDTTTTTVDADEVVGKFDVGGGVQLHLVCRGVGTPVVVMEAGDEDRGASWQEVQRPISQLTRTCTYDRAGVAGSGPATGCRGLQELNDDLDALLAAAGEDEGPFVFVGASGGGYLAAGMAERHADEVQGLVLVDTFKAIEYFPPGLREELACDAPTNLERRDYVAVEHEVWDDRTAIGDFPVTIITNDYGAPAEGDELGNVEAQQGWFDLTTGTTKQIVVTSGHEVQHDDPDVIITAIEEIVEAARAG